MLACLSVPCHAEPQTDIRGDLQAICCRMLAVKSPSVYDYSPASNRCSHALANMKWERETRVPLPYPTAPPSLCRQPVQCNRICWQQIAHLHIWEGKKAHFQNVPHMAQTGVGKWSTLARMLVQRPWRKVSLVVRERKFSEQSDVFMTMLILININSNSKNNKKDIDICHTWHVANMFSERENKKWIKWHPQKYKTVLSLQT